MTAPRPKIEPERSPGVCRRSAGETRASDHRPQLTPPSTRPPEMNLTPQDVEGLVGDLVEYHARFCPSFRRREQRHWALRYMEGQMLELKRKCIEPMALYLDGGNVQAMQQFISEGTWDDRAVLETHQELVDESLGEEAGVLIVDSSEFPKQGHHSVGVARQYCGVKGKVDNCQSGMFLGYSSSKGFTLLDRRLFLPEKWFGEEYRERREKCRVPEDLVFKTKPELAWEMIEEVDRRGIVRFCWVAGDSLFGRTPWLLDQIDGTGRYYMMEVPLDTHLWLHRPETYVPERSGRGRRPSKVRLAPGEPSSDRADELARGLDGGAWDRCTVQEGCKGPVVAEFAIIRVVASRRGLPGPDVWLIMRRRVGKDPEEAPLRAFLSNAPVGTPLSTFLWVWSHRWTIETTFEDCKGELGMDEYEVRGWRAWHHHMTMTLLSHHFLVRMWLKLGDKAPALTVPQTVELLSVVLPRKEFDAEEALGLIRYRQEHNYAAYRSHRKRRRGK